MGGTMREPARDLPVAGEYDVVVAGGGPTGVGAALASARRGARTLLIERYGALGGLMTTGLHYHFSRLAGEGTKEYVIRGVPLEICERMVGLGAGGMTGDGCLDYDPEVMKRELDRLMEEAGCEVLLHAWAVGVLREGARVEAVVVESKSGRECVRAKVFIEATGDGDLAAFAGAPFEKGRPADGLMQPVTLMFRVRGVDWPRLAEYRRTDRALEKALRAAIDANEMPPFQTKLMGFWHFEGRPDEVGVNLTHVVRVDATNARDLARAEVGGRRQVQWLLPVLRGRVPGFGNAVLVDTAQAVGVRETRRVLGDHVLTREDVIEARQFEDQIAQNSFGVDIHRCDGPGLQCWDRITGGASHGIPYRCLTPRGLDNLLVAGRCISATHEAVGSIRVMAPSMAMGEAAGAAAAVCARASLATRAVDVQALRADLAARGALCDLPASLVAAR